MIKYNKNQINQIFDCIHSEAAYLNSDDYFEIDEDIVEDDDELEKIISPLYGYKVKLNQRGEHINDGQMIEYIFKFKSPIGKKTIVSTEMCYMISWNHPCSVQIN